jgi:hypothetical protein
VCLYALNGNFQGVREPVSLIRKFLGDLLLQLVPGEFINGGSQLLRIGADRINHPRQNEREVDLRRRFRDLSVTFFARYNPGHEKRRRPEPAVSELQFEN